MLPNGVLSRGSKSLIISDSMADQYKDSNPGPLEQIEQKSSALNSAQPNKTTVILMC